VLPFLRNSNLRRSMQDSYSMGLANSPVNGLLYVRGTIGARQPACTLHQTAANLPRSPGCCSYCTLKWPSSFGTELAATSSRIT
jgi:hypothetical protein